MGGVIAIVNAIALCNSRLLALGGWLAWVALALMVVVILLQVVFRYVFNNALPWPDEAARFLMLWMTGLAAPMAYRHGGFVAIDSLQQRMPRLMGATAAFVLLVLSLVVILYAIQFGWNHTFGFGGQFRSSSLKVPLALFGSENIAIQLRYMYGSLLTGMVLLMLVNTELLLRSVIVIAGKQNCLQPISQFGASTGEKEC